MYEDTYFLNPEEAIRVASLQNRWGDNNYFLQVCYYDGEVIESEFSNLIHLSLDNLVDELAQGIYRIPSKLDFTGLDLSAAIKLDILTNFNISIEHANNYRNQYNNYYLNSLRSQKLDFSEPLRFHFLASTSTQVMQHVARSIVDELREQGCEVFFDLRTGVEDSACFKKILEFNPHATVNINHLNNSYLCEDAFNFIWFQDPMPMLYDETLIEIRPRDFVFSLLKEFDTPLAKKGIQAKRQGFCVNKKNFKVYGDIETKKKIVFVGSSYGSMIPNDDNVSDAIEYTTRAFEDGKLLGESFGKELAKRFALNENFVFTMLIPFIVRDISVLWLCSLNTQYEIEIYGHGWEHYESVKPFYKGALTYGTDVAKVYSSATFAFAPHSLYILQQRVLEASACGAIPIVYDCLNPSEPKIYEESLKYFKTKQDLYDILTKSNLQNKNFDKLLSENSYEHFVNDMIETIKRVVNE